MKPSLIVHGGAWNIPDAAIIPCREGCRRALETGWKILSAGGAVVLEEDPVFDAGVGSHLNREGNVQLDAIVMDGATLKAGAVAAVERIRNPIRLARKIMEESEHMMFVGPGAEQFAVEHGIALCAPEELIIDSERNAWRRCLADQHAAQNHHGHADGTVGAVALDASGLLFAGTSTGGTCCKLPGRVGDSPLIGCGCYADAQTGGVSCTGHGEGIMKIVMAKSAIDLLRRAPDPQAAANAAVDLLHIRANTTGGLILLDASGKPAAQFNTPYMAHGYVQPDGSFFVSP
jgi:beta-aspartyl-peptidase (threonine type)